MKPFGDVNMVHASAYLGIFVMALFLTIGYFTTPTIPPIINIVLVMGIFLISFWLFFGWLIDKF